MEIATNVAPVLSNTPPKPNATGENRRTNKVSFRTKNVSERFPHEVNDLVNQPGFLRRLPRIPNNAAYPIPLAIPVMI